MERTISGKLVDILKQKIPAGENAASLLMDIIPIGREAAYRRLRGENQFTLGETARICQRMNISLDQLLGLKHLHSYTFHTNPVFSENNLAEYCKMLDEIIAVWEHIKLDPTCFGYSAVNTVPHKFLFDYEILSKVNLYIWLYQVFPHSIPHTLSEIEIPKEVRELEKKSIKVRRNVDVHLIVDIYGFSRFTDSIRYFYDLGMINKEEIKEIKQALFLLLEDMETCAARGEYQDGYLFNLYLSHTSFDCTYEYLESKKIRASSIRTYGIDYLSSENDIICDWQKMWIESLMRYSSLISISGELQRNEYFKKQRSIVEEL